VRERDTVKAIRDYFKHLLETKHKKMREEEEPAPSTPAAATNGKH